MWHALILFGNLSRRFLPIVKILLSKTVYFFGFIRHFVISTFSLLTTKRLPTLFDVLYSDFVLKLHNTSNTSFRLNFSFDVFLHLRN